MGFSMRIQFSDEVIKKQSFCHMFINGQKNGFEFDVQMPYYRALFLSGMEDFKVCIDGETIPQEALTFEINQKEMPVYKLKYASTELWRQNECARIRAIKPGGLSAGAHTLEMTLYMRIPYMQMGDGHNYMMLDGCDTVIVNLDELEEIQ